jgi:hypothetical protein
MTTITSNLNENLRPDTNLETLHFESQRWLDSVAFWDNEIISFKDLLKNKSSAKKNKYDYFNTLKTLEKIHLDFLEGLKDDIIKYERLFPNLEKSEKKLTNVEHRKKHQQLKKRIDTWTHNFIILKKIISDYAE